MIDRVIKHAEDVVNGRTIDGSLHKKSCERFLHELSIQGSEDFPYTWNPQKANRIIEFAETLTVSEGYEKRRISLYDHQCFDFGNLF